MSESAERPRRVLIVDDEADIRGLLCFLAKAEELEPLQAEDGLKALRLFRREVVDVVLLDLHMPVMNGLRVLREIRKSDSATPVIMLTADGSIDAVVQAVKSGATDYISKPFQNDELIRTIRQAFASAAPRPSIRSAGAEHESLVERMGPSEQVGRLIVDVERVAATDFTVLISGETGVGKELVARAIHHASPRAAALFVPVDCGAIPATLIESELFGHEKGAFTGADRKREGKFEVAASGTLFLDEIQNLPLSVQTRFLRALQEKQICHVGGTECVHIDLRVVVATNRDLAELVSEGAFRQDLYHRLNEFSIHIPPLRERRDDILYLSKRFMEGTCAELHKPLLTMTPSAVEALLAHPWFGNVRELRNVIRRAVLLAEDAIDARHVVLSGAPATQARVDVASENDEQGSLKERMRERVMRAEREILLRVLRQTGGNKAEAARLLKIDYKTIRMKARQYGIFINRGGDPQVNARGS